MKPILRNGKLFIIPENVDLNQPGIYKISFDDYFYIGSTSNFKKRIMVFRGGCIKKGSAFSKKMFECATNCSIISFEILKVVNDTSLLRETETYFIKLFAGNPFLINRSCDANSNNGVKWTEEERLKISASTKNKPKSKQTRLRMKMSKLGLCVINKYSVSGDYISSYNSCLSASLDSGMANSTVLKILNGEKDSHKGVTFKMYFKSLPKKKKINPIGLPKGYKFSEEVKNNQIERRRLKPQFPSHTKPVIQFDISGNKINEFPAISFAAKYIGVSRQAFNKSVKENPNSYYKGYIWKYA